MSAANWLIAEREFRTYVATLSFWIALAIGPMVVGGGFLLEQSYHRPSPPLAISIESADPSLAQSAKAALAEAGRLEGRQYRFDDMGARLSLSRVSSHSVKMNFSAQFPLSATGRMLVARTLERDEARQALSAGALTVHEFMPTAPHRLQTEVIARFALMMMLWLTLTGSLGMLLQTVVRERATRSLESLLASTTPWQIMTGKLIGIGAVSLLVLATWLGSSVALTFFTPNSDATTEIIAEMATPNAWMRTGLIYLLAYGFYGSLTIALGARARDSASAQNLARPMFILLLAAFFIPLASITAGGAPEPNWLLFVPPFTPFLMLLYPPGAIPASVEFMLLAVLLISSIVAAHLAVRGFALSQGNRWRFFPNSQLKARRQP